MEGEVKKNLEEEGKRKQLSEYVTCKVQKKPTWNKIKNKKEWVKCEAWGFIS